MSLSRKALAAGLLVAPIFLAPAAAQRGAPAVHRIDVAPAVPDGRAAPPALGPTGVGVRPTIMLTGYWPPSNEAVREFSQSPQQNPGGWIGSDWESRGYDVVSFFPEFQPPNCQSCGRGMGDLEVDYQDTSPDFWRLVDQVRPIAIVTTSRDSFGNRWELEMNQFNRSSWVPDYVAPVQPTVRPPEVGVAAGLLRPSTLPAKSIAAAVSASGLGIPGSICFSGSGGGFLSEYVAYHGVWYQNLHASPADPDRCIAAGHVHIGPLVTWPTARQAMRVTLRVLTAHLDAVRAATVQQANLGLGGPGSSTLVVAGQALASGGRADLLLHGAAPNAAGALVLGPALSPVSLFGGTLAPAAPLVAAPFMTDPGGRFLIRRLRGGGGPTTVILQGIHVDGGLPGGFGFSNALSLDIRR